MADTKKSSAETTPGLKRRHQLPIQYVGYENHTPRFATNFVINGVAPDEWIITFGTMAVQPFLRDEDLQGIKSAHVDTIARVLLGRRHLRELIDVLIRVYNESEGNAVYTKQSEADNGEGAN